MIPIPRVGDFRGSHPTKRGNRCRYRVDQVPRVQISRHNKGQGVHPHAVMCSIALDQASLLRRAPVLLRVPWLHTTSLCLGGLRRYHASLSSGPRPALGVGSSTAMCLLAPNRTSSLKRAPLLPHVLWLSVGRGLQE
jgi:hypothetical protein